MTPKNSCYDNTTRIDNVMKSRIKRVFRFLMFIGLCEEIETKFRRQQHRISLTLSLSPRSSLAVHFEACAKLTTRLMVSHFPSRWNVNIFPCSTRSVERERGEHCRFQNRLHEKDMKTYTCVLWTRARTSE